MRPNRNWCVLDVDLKGPIILDHEHFYNNSKWTKGNSRHCTKKYSFLEQVQYSGNIYKERDNSFHLLINARQVQLYIK